MLRLPRKECKAAFFVSLMACTHDVGRGFSSNGRLVSRSRVSNTVENARAHLDRRSVRLRLRPPNYPRRPYHRVRLDHRLVVSCLFRARRFTFFRHAVDARDVLPPRAGLPALPELEAVRALPRGRGRHAQGRRPRGYTCAASSEEDSRQT